MAKLTPEEFQQKHAQNLKASTTYIQKGIERVTTSPTEKAAQKADKYLAGIQKAVNDGKWQGGLRRVSLDEWKQKTIQKGIPRISAGIDGAKEKTIDFASKLLPHVDRGVEKVRNMPDLTIDDSINRAAAFIRHMSEFKR